MNSLTIRWVFPFGVALIVDLFSWTLTLMVAVLPFYALFYSPLYSLCRLPSIPSEFKAKYKPTSYIFIRYPSKFKILGTYLQNCLIFNKENVPLHCIMWLLEYFCILFIYLKLLCSDAYCRSILSLSLQLKCVHM